MRYGPIFYQHEQWRRIGKRLLEQRSANRQADIVPNPYSDRVLIVIGRNDPIIVEKEIVSDATDALGPDNVRFEFCDAGHELPMTDCQLVVNHIWQFWKME